MTGRATWALLLAAVALTSEAEPRFEPLQPGITATHTAADYWSTGQAWADVDNDGCIDAYVTDAQGINGLWLGDCAGNFALAPWNEAIALADAVSGGASFADIDNDGDSDLYVLNQGGNHLFINQAGQGFTDETDARGVGNGGEGETAAWGDFDGDGDADLYVVNWYWQNDPEHVLARDALYRNRGDGHFEDVTLDLLPDDEVLRRPGFAASFLDFDNDGDLDLYVVNDKRRGNALWRNDGAGCSGWCFSEIATAVGALRPTEAMGLAVGDYDGDEDLDLFFTGEGEMVLLQNRLAQGETAFIEVSSLAGVDYAAIGWGCAFVDVDNDGWLDLYAAVHSSGPADRRNRLWRNRGDGTFEDLSSGSGADDGAESTGLAIADFDQDNRIDLLIGNWGSGYRVLHNQTDPASAAVTVAVMGDSHSVTRDASGTRVTLVLDDGRRLLRELKNGSSLGAGNELTLHFGLGSAMPLAAEVRWPDGLEDRHTLVPACGRWILDRDRIHSADFDTPCASGTDPSQGGR